jgi:cytidylate kinase
MSKKLIIAIDGPAGSGKSTSAKLVAQKLNYLYIDTGAMYRTVTLLAIRNNVLNNTEAVIELTKNTQIELEFKEGITWVRVNGENVTEEIRLPEVNKNVSEISKIPEVRKLLVAKQREMIRTGIGVVMEGRDIGTVVFPDADVKIFMTATIDERAFRRTKEFIEKGKNVPLEDVKKNLEERDTIDSSRSVSPLTMAYDAVLVDTSKVTIDEQVNIILEKVKETAAKKGLTVFIA